MYKERESMYCGGIGLLGEEISVLGEAIGVLEEGISGLEVQTSVLGKKAVYWVRKRCTGEGKNVLGKVINVPGEKSCTGGETSVLVEGSVYWGGNQCTG